MLPYNFSDENHCNLAETLFCYIDQWNEIVPSFLGFNDIIFILI